ncbi:unnamed protein product [Linum tenue]|uniref:Replication protein A subunit n=1 Tax=Linum tenue TaxID=586396 RepID=A0AAV0M7W6_9ROSI|nr:unnamed protein product [Linum tenue]
MADLTQGAIALIAGGATSGELQPTLQVTELKKVQAKQQQQQQGDRFRLLLSDGSHLQQAMLGTQLNHLVQNGNLRAGSIVHMKQYSCSVIQNRMIIIILELDVLLQECPLIGNPSLLKSSGTPDPPNPHLAGPAVTNPNPPANSVQYPRLNQPNSGSYTTGYDSARNAGGTTVSSFGMKSETGVTSLGPSSSGMPYANQSAAFRNSRQEGTGVPPGGYSNMSKPAYQQPPPMYSNRGPVARNEAPARIIPISALNPYQGRWTIKARVTAKAEMRHYNNPRGDGKVFSFDLLDSDGGEIRVTCFNAVADQFYSQIEVGSVYLISKGTLKPAQKNFNHLHHDLEISLDNGSTVQQCHDDDNSIPRQQFHFRPISEVEGMDNNSVVDIIGIVSSVSPATSIMRKNGTETQKRSIQLKDMSGRSVELTLWGNFCGAEGQELQNMCEAGHFPVLAVKSGRVNDFSGKAVGTISTSQLLIEPDFAEAQNLKQWFDRDGKNTPSISISREWSGAGRTDVVKTISQIKDEKLGTSEKPDWISVNAAVVFIKQDNFCYTACPLMLGDRQCNKKVTNNGDGRWRCDRCEQSVDECDYRYILSLQIQDHTGSTWLTAFQESAEELMGISAKDLYFMKFEKQDDDGFSKVLRRVMFVRYIFKLKVKEETFSDEQRVKSTLVKADKVNYGSLSKTFLGLMENFKSGNLTASVPKVESSYTNSVQSSPGKGNFGSGQTGSSSMGLPANQAGQYSNQYNSRVPTPTASGGPILCNICGGTGHIASNCPRTFTNPQQPVRGAYVNRTLYGAGAGGGGGGGGSECYKCHQFGHFARDCPGSATGPQSHGNRYGGGYANQQIGGF